MQNKSTLLDLSDDILIHHIPLNFKMLHALKYTCSRFSGLFSADSLTNQTFKLLKYVINADYPSASSLVLSKPELMFNRITFFNENDHPEQYSPLEYAFKLLDAYMWRIFYNIIKDKNEYVKIFLQQAQNCEKPISLTPFLEAYKQYIALSQNQIHAHGFNQLTHQACIDLLGKAQKKYLPFWMVKEFCRLDSTWSKGMFDIKNSELPIDCFVTNIVDGDIYKHPLEKAYPYLGESFALSRIPQNIQDAYMMTTAIASYIAKQNRDGFKKLYESSLNELKNHIALLEKSFDTSKKMVL